MNTPKLKIIIVDDNDMFRNAVKLYLQNEMKFDIIGEASNGLQFLKLKNIFTADFCTSISLFHTSCRTIQASGLCRNLR